MWHVRQRAYGLVFIRARSSLTCPKAPEPSASNEHRDTRPSASTNTRPAVTQEHGAPLVADTCHFTCPAQSTAAKLGSDETPARMPARLSASTAGPAFSGRWRLTQTRGRAAAEHAAVGGASGSVQTKDPAAAVRCCSARRPRATEQHATCAHAATCACAATAAAGLAPCEQGFTGHCCQERRSRRRPARTHDRHAAERRRRGKRCCRRDCAC